MVCSCGHTETDYIRADVDHMTHDDIKQMSVSRRYTYKRINHFREFLRETQGKTNSPPSQDLLNVLRLEFSRSYVKVKDITPGRVRKQLKKLNLSEYYEMSVIVAVMLNPSFVPINIPPEREEKLCYQFMRAEPAFEKTKSDVNRSRRNFMSYPVTAYKLCELNGWLEYLPAFTLLKSTKLMIEQDSYWRRVCEETGWVYKRTVGNVLLSSMFAPRRRPGANSEGKQAADNGARPVTDKAQDAGGGGVAATRKDDSDEYCMKPYDEEEWNAPVDDFAGDSDGSQYDESGVEWA